MVFPINQRALLKYNKLEAKIFVSENTLTKINNEIKTLKNSLESIGFTKSEIDTREQIESKKSSFFAASKKIDLNEDDIKQELEKKNKLITFFKQDVMDLKARISFEAQKKESILISSNIFKSYE